jgi:hypothetical protein
MFNIIKETTSQKVVKALEEQGRKRSWLANQFGIAYPTLASKITNNTWSKAELYLLEQVLGIK